MRALKVIAIVLFLSFLTISAGCNPFAGTQTTQIQQTEVTRGDLVVKVNGSGKTAVSTDARVAFSVGGKIDKIFVKKGDRVTKGMVLAKLETDNLELAVSQAKTSLAQAQTASSQAVVALSQAETAVQVAQFNLDKIKDVADIKDDMVAIQTRIDVDQTMVASPGSNTSYWLDVIKNEQRNLAQKKRDLAELLGKPEYAGVVSYDLLADKYGRIVVDDVKVKQSQIKSAEQSITQAQKSVEQAQSSVELAQKTLSVAQKQLSDATLTATIGGVVATLDIKEGDVIPPVTVTLIPAVYLIDPGTMEININVDEIDVPSIKVNQTAVISLDALPDTKLQGKVTYISLVPDVQSGVVVYQTKIAFAVPPTIELRIGMSATADIIINEHKNVVLVPTLAIKQDSQNKPYVEVVVNQNIEQRAIVIGLSDGIQTEVVGGLKEGDIAVIGKTQKASGLFLQ